MLPVSGQFSSGPAFLFRLGFDIPRTSEIVDRKHCCETLSNAIVCHFYNPQSRTWQFLQSSVVVKDDAPVM